MGASAALLDNTVISVTPGGDASCEVKVRNTGDVVDEFTFQVLGTAAAWATVEPTALSLFPGGEGSARVTFRPPRKPSTPSGVVPFGIRVVSNEEPEGSVVVESAVDVAPFTALMADLAPRTSRGRFAGRHTISISNRGNQTLAPLLGATDPDDALKFDVPAEVEVTSGTASFAKLRASPRNRFWWRPAQTHPFTVVAEATGEAPITLQGNMLQEPIIPRWLPKALLALAALALLWFFLLKPTVESTARDAIQDPKTKVNVELAAAKDANEEQQAQIADQAATQQQQADEIKEIKDTIKSDATQASGKTFDGRLQSNCPPECTRDLQINPNKQLSITDIVLQNPKGDTGTLTLLRNDAVLLQVALENFRDLDYHFISAWIFQGGDKFVLEIACNNTAEAGGTAPPCSAAVSFAGTLQTIKA